MRRPKSLKTRRGFLPRQATSGLRVRDPGTGSRTGTVRKKRAAPARPSLRASPQEPGTLRARDDPGRSETPRTFVNVARSPQVLPKNTMCEGNRVFSGARVELGLDPAEPGLRPARCRTDACVADNCGWLGGDRSCGMRASRRHRNRTRYRRSAREGNRRGGPRRSSG